MVAGFPLFSNFDQCPFDGVFMVNWVFISGLLPCFVFFKFLFACYYHHVRFWSCVMIVNFLVIF